jgi:hypothetical protein
MEVKQFSETRANASNKFRGFENLASIITK